MAPQLSFTGFAWKNLWCRRLKTLLKLGGITMGIGAFAVYVAFSPAFEQEWLRLYTSAGTDIAVIETNFLSSSLHRFLAPGIIVVSDVDKSAPMIFNLMTLTPDVNALAYDWLSSPYEFDSLTLTSGHRFRDGQPEALLDDILAGNLNKRVGDGLPIRGTIFNVVGIHRGGTALEASAVILPLGQMQIISSMHGKAATIHTQLRPVPPEESQDQYIKHASRKIETILSGIKAVLAAERAANNHLAHSVSWATSSIALLVGISGIANTIATSVFEHMREIGILRALGWKGRHVILLILTEATGLEITRGLLGILLGCGALCLLSIFPQIASVVSASVSPYHLLESLFIAVASGLAAGAYPAWHGAHLSPMEALRHD